MVPEMLENEVNDESNVETFVVGGDNYTVLILLLLLHTLFFLFPNPIFFQLRREAAESDSLLNLPSF
jgi:hypothetical protein